MPLTQYIRTLAAEVIPDQNIANIRLLTFPRILGAVFNPLSVYVASDASGQIVIQEQASPNHPRATRVR